MATGRATLATIVAAVLMLSTSARSQVIGPQLPKGIFEIALQNRCTDRSMWTEGGLKFELERRDVALVFRWAITEFATISTEGMTGTNDFVVGENDLQEFYLVGAGAQATLWRNQRFLVSGALQYTRTFRRWEENRPDQFQDSFSWQATVQTDLSVARQSVTLFAGPLYSDETLSVLETLFTRRTTLDPTNTWGGVVGTAVLLGGHVAVNAQLFWVENPQPRFGVGYRF